METREVKTNEKLTANCHDYIRT